MPTNSLKEKWRQFAIEDDSFEDNGVRLNAERIATFFIEEFIKMCEEAKIETSVELEDSGCNSCADSIIRELKK